MDLRHLQYLKGHRVARITAQRFALAVDKRGWADFVMALVGGPAEGQQSQRLLVVAQKMDRNVIVFVERSRSEAGKSLRVRRLVPAPVF